METWKFGELEARFQRVIESLINLNQTPKPLNLQTSKPPSLQTPKPPSLQASKPLAIALSGGSDSLALLHLTHRLYSDTPLVALTVDHGLRPESAREAEQVQGWMQALGVEHHILRWTPPSAQESGNLQAQARQGRYQLLCEYCERHDIPYLLVGHTADDQAETIAFRQQRGAGEVGLSGISARRSLGAITLLRPLLAHYRMELQDWLTAQPIDWIHDPSNDNREFSRIRIRQALAHDPERKMALLALGKDMAAKRMQIERDYAEFVGQHVIQNRRPSESWDLGHKQTDSGEDSCFRRNDGLEGEERRITATLPPLLALPEPQAAYTLGQLLCHLNGRDYPPRYAKLQRALQQMAAPGFHRLTLGRCVLTRQKHQLQIEPEGDSSLPRRKPLVNDPFVPIFPL